MIVPLELGKFIVGLLFGWTVLSAIVAINEGSAEFTATANVIAFSSAAVFMLALLDFITSLKSIATSTVSAGQEK